MVRPREYRPISGRYSQQRSNPSAYRAIRFRADDGHVSFHDHLQLATGVDPTLIGVGLFMAMIFVLWALTHLIERP